MIENKSLGVSGSALLAAILLGGCIADPELKLTNEHVPVVRSDGWIVSTPESEGMNGVLVDKAYDLFFSNDRYRTAISLLVVRNGKLVGEGYCQNRNDIDVKRNIKSCTKSFTSLLTGIALDRGMIRALDDRLSDYLPEFFEANSKKASITIAQALTMRTGLPYNNDEDNEDLLVDPPESSLRYVLSGDLEYDPGERFHYSDAPPHLVGAVIARQAGTSLDAFADSTLFKPLGITDYLWEKHRDGLCYGAFGIYMKPRDLAKIGQMVLQEGQWEGQQIVPASWIQEEMQVRAYGAIGPYGYYWWIRPDFSAFTMEGHGGNFVYVIPDKRLVIVFTANPFVQGSIAITTSEFEDIVEHLVSSVN